VVVEGYRGQAGIAFLEVRRAGAQPSAEGQGSERATRPPPAGRIAIVSDVLVPQGAADDGLPILDINDVDAIAQFIVRHLELLPC